MDLDYSDGEDGITSGKKRQRLTKVQPLPSWTTKINKGKPIFGTEKS